MEQTYNSQNLNVSANNIPSGETIAFTYTKGGITVVPRNVDDYLVAEATSTNYYYTLPAYKTFRITKAAGGAISIPNPNIYFSGASSPAVSVSVNTGEQVTLTYYGTPITVGDYTVVTAESPNYTYTVPSATKITIIPVTYTYSISTVSAGYTGTPLPVSITYQDPSYTGTVWYTGISNLYTRKTPPPTNRGSYYIEVISSSPNYVFAVTGTSIYTITQAVAIVTFNDGTLLQTYTGGLIEVHYTVNRAVNEVIVTYDNSLTKPMNIGTYAASAIVNDINIIGSESGTLTVVPQVVTIVIGNRTQTYSGQSKSVTYTTDYPRPIIVFYDGVSDLPIDAGTYTVYAYVDQSTSVNYVGSTTTTLTITKAVAPVSLYNLSQIYKGTGLTPYALTIPAGLAMEYTFNGTQIAPINVGSYSAVATINDSNYSGTAIGTLQITVATAYVKLFSLTQAFTGEPIEAGVITYPYGLTTIITYNGLSTIPVNPGSYMVGVIIDDQNHIGFGYDTLTIPKLTAIVTLSSLSQAYTGEFLSTTVITKPAHLDAIFLYDDLLVPPSSVGSYSVVANINDTFYAGAATNTFVINKAVATVTFDTLEQMYTGSYLSTTATTNPEGLAVDYTYNGSNWPPANVGVYDVIATVNDDTYVGVGSGAFRVQMASTPITFLSSMATYNGGTHVARAIASPSNLFIDYKYYKYNTNILIPTPSNASAYTVKASVLYDSNYGGDLYSTFTINKAMGKVLFTSNAYTFPYSNAIRIFGTTSPYKNLNIAYTYSSINYNSPIPPTEIGSYTVLGEITGTTNWTGYGSAALSIVKATGIVSFPNTIVPYTGQPLPISTIITANTSRGSNLALNTTILYNNEYSTPPTKIGIYSAKATIDDPRWWGYSTLSKYTITKGVATIHVSSIVATYSIPYSMSTLVTPDTLTPSYMYSNATYYSATPPVNASAYNVFATVDTDLYYGFSTGDLTIQKYTEPVYIAGLTQIYTGSPVTPYVVTDIVAEYTYETLDSVTLAQQPSAIGNYKVYAELNDSNYEGQSNAYFSVVLGPLISLSAYPVSTGVILLWSPPVSPAALQYIVNTIPPVVPPFTTVENYTRVSTLTNGTPYMFSVTPEYRTRSTIGMPYQAYISPYAGTGVPGYADDEESLATMNTPSDLVFDSAGNMYVADTLNGRVRKIDKNGTVTTVASECGHAQGIAIDSANNLYVSDALNHVIYKITNSGTKTIFAGTYGESGTDNGTDNGTDAKFNTPKGLIVYTQGSTTYLLIADSGNHVIRSVDMSSNNVDTFTGTGIAGLIDAQGLNAAFDTPNGLAVDSFNNIYVADTGNNTLRKIDTNPLRNVTTIVGTTYMDGVGAVAQFSSPSRIAIDPLNNVFISDTGNNVIRKMSPDRAVTTIVGYKKAGMTNGLGTAATLNAPLGLAFDPHMNLYVADSKNHVIRTITFTPIASATPAQTKSSYSPLPPTNVSVVNNSESVTLSWTPSQQPVLPLSAYRIQYAGISVIISGLEVSTVISGLNSETDYTFDIYALNVFGESATATSVSTSTIKTNVEFQIGATSQYYTGSRLDIQITTIPPDLNPEITYDSAPIEIGDHTGRVTVNSGRYVGSVDFSLSILDPKPMSATNVLAVAGDGRATISWTPPTNTGQGPITNYTITTPDIPILTTANNTITYAVITGLTNGQSYSFTVIANNYFGASPSAISAAVMPKGVPSAPLSVLATADALGSVTVSWDSPTSTGGYPITSYTIRPVSTTISVTTNNSPYIFSTGLRGGYEYVFEVQATNAAGTGPASIASNSAIALTVPEKPTVSAIRGYKKATVSWNIPSSGGRPITTFVIQTNPATSVYNTPDGATQQYEIYGLDDHVTYSFSVYGVNELGDGDAGTTPLIVGKPVLPQRGNRPSWFS